MSAVIFFGSWQFGCRSLTRDWWTGGLACTEQSRSGDGETRKFFLPITSYLLPITSYPLVLSDSRSITLSATFAKQL
jgi:hypothetical protein